jgi:hypothetical protein
MKAKKKVTTKAKSKSLDAPDGKFTLNALLRKLVDSGLDGYLIAVRSVDAAWFHVLLDKEAACAYVGAQLPFAEVCIYRVERLTVTTRTVVEIVE